MLGVYAGISGQHVAIIRTVESLGIAKCTVCVIDQAAHSRLSSEQGKLNRQTCIPSTPRVGSITNSNLMSFGIVGAGLWEM